MYSPSHRREFKTTQNNPTYINTTLRYLVTALVM